MAISRQHRFIFIKINKTGGTAVQHTLEAFAPDLDEKGHRVLSDYHVDLDSYFKFAFVRNPWDKMVSFYAYHNKRGFDLLPHHPLAWWRRLLPLNQHSAHPTPTFREFILEEMHQMEYKKKHGVSSHLLRTANQLDWLTDHHGQVRMDFIGRFETLQHDFDMVCLQCGFPITPLPVVNASAHAHYTSYYDTETCAAVERAFAKDIEYFGYRFGD